MIQDSIETKAPPKEILIRTNLNNKLDCPIFLHIELAKTYGIPESELEARRFLFITKDRSHKPVLAKVIDSIRCELGQIPNVCTYMSHGMEKEEFIQTLISSVGNTSRKTGVVAYFYKQVEQ